MIKAVLNKDGLITLNTEKKSSLDYKTFSGKERLLLRSYNDLKDNADGHFLNLASSLCLLTDWDGNEIKLKDGIYSLTLNLKKIGNGYLSSLCFESLNDEIRCYIKDMVLVNNSLFRTRTRDVKKLFMLNQKEIKREDLESFLSIALSEYEGLKINVEGYKTILKSPINVKSALIFSEIDEYNYLHLKTDLYLDDYGLMKSELTTSVRIDEEDKTLEIREIVINESPSERLKKILNKIDKTGYYEEKGIFIIESDTAKNLIENHFKELLSSFVILQSEVIRNYKVRYAKPVLALSVHYGISYLETDGNIEIDGQSIMLEDFFYSIKRNGDFVVLPDGSKAYIDISFISRIKRLITENNGNFYITKADLPYIESLPDVALKAEEKETLFKFYKDYNRINDDNRDGKLKTSKLRDYQNYGYKWLKYLSDNNMGSCLADDMGLGKTVQVIALLNSEAVKTEKPNLIVSPKSLIFNWMREIERFAIDIPTYIYYADEKSVEKVIDMKKGIVLTSYGTLRSDISKLKDIDFNYLILDEAQSLKNFNTATAKAASEIKAEHKTALSGTVIENNLSEIYSLFKIINPSLFKSFAAFNREYIKPIYNQNSDALKELKMKIKPFILRRVKEDVLKDLPEKSEQTVIIEMKDEHFSYYRERQKVIRKLLNERIESDGINRSSFMILQALNELRILSSSPEIKGQSSLINSKREYLKDTIPEIVKSSHKCLIFTFFLDSLSLIAEDMASLGIGCLKLSGSSENREEIIDRFTFDDSINVLIMTLKTGGVGLNLTKADYVFIFDPWWNSAAEEQAISRSHRIGQKNPVFVYRLISKDTIEEKILALQEKKREISKEVFESDNTLIKSLSKEDIEMLIR